MGSNHLMALLLLVAGNGCTMDVFMPASASEAGVAIPVASAFQTRNGALRGQVGKAGQVDSDAFAWVTVEPTTGSLLLELSARSTTVDTTIGLDRSLELLCPGARLELAGSPVLRLIAATGVPQGMEDEIDRLGARASSTVVEGEDTVTTVDAEGLSLAMDPIDDRWVSVDFTTRHWYDGALQTLYGHLEMAPDSPSPAAVPWE